MTQKNIQTYISDVKFPAEHDPVFRKKYKNRGKPKNRKTHIFLEKFITEKPTLIKTPNLAEMYFNTIVVDRLYAQMGETITIGPQSKCIKEYFYQLLLSLGS